MASDIREGDREDEALEGCDSRAEGAHVVPETADVTQLSSGFVGHI